MKLWKLLGLALILWMAATIGSTQSSTPSPPTTPHDPCYCATVVPEPTWTP